MKTLNIVAVISATRQDFPHLDESLLKQIRAVDPSIRVTDASALAAGEHRGDAGAKEKLDALLAGAEVLVGFIPPRDLQKRAPRLKWVQLMSAGVDSLIGSEIWQSRITITGVSGIHATPISEYVLGTMLMFAKQSPRSFRMQQQHEWKRFTPQLLRGRTIGIIGLGHIGREVARLAKSFGMKVLAVDEIRGTRPATNVDIMIPANQLRRLFADSDFVISCVPLTPKTSKLIGEKELRAMKKTAYLINISRGGIVDEDALIRALDEKWIAGAGLDVTVREPLPPDSRLWDFENVIITPHISGGQEDYLLLATALFCENLKRYLNGKKLMNVIIRKRGY
ncbi:MAG: D-2-hydroxyacid dehydrogenase [Dehalococcoidales bacterium]